MEADEFKAMWQEHNRNISENLQVNIQLLKHNILSKSNYIMRQPFLFELFSIAVYFVLTIFLIAFTIKFGDEPRFAIPGFFACLLSCGYLVITAIKIKRYSAIDYYTTPVIQLQKQIAQLHIQVIKFRKLEILMVIPFTLAALPILFKALYGVDLFIHRTLFIIEVSAIFGIGFPLMLWFSKNLYDKKFTAGKDVLAGFTKYENEDRS